MTKIGQYEIHPFAELFPPMPDDQYQALKADIAENGQSEDIIIWQDKLIDGRHRLRACLELGIQPDTAELDDASDPYIYVISHNLHRRHLSTSQRSMVAAKLATLKKGGDRKSEDFKGQICTSIDEAALQLNVSPRSVKTAKQVIEHGSKAIVDAVESGEITVFQAQEKIKKQKKRQELQKAVADLSNNAQEINPWRIYNCDVIDGLQSISDELRKAELIFADPPYNIGIDYGNGEEADKLTNFEYMIWVDRWLNECVNLLSDNGTMWVMIGDEYAGEYACKLKQLGLTIRNWVKWYETFGVTCKDKFNRTSRHLFYCVKDPKNFTFNAEFVTRPSDRQTKYNDRRAAPDGKLWDDVWSIPRLTGTCNERVPDVPTQLPLDLVRPIIESCSMPGDLVVDPFAGSGTTGVAALQTGRWFAGVEAQPKYCEIIKGRLRNAT
jgi:DNA modification methylase